MNTKAKQVILDNPILFYSNWLHKVLLYYLEHPDSQWKPLCIKLTMTTKWLNKVKPLNYFSYIPVQWKVTMRTTFYFYFFLVLFIKWGNTVTSGTLVYVPDWFPSPLPPPSPMFEFWSLGVFSFLKIFIWKHILAIYILWPLCCQGLQNFTFLSTTTVSYCCCIFCLGLQIFWWI